MFRPDAMGRRAGPSGRAPRASRRRVPGCDTRRAPRPAGARAGNAATRRKRGTAHREKAGRGAGNKKGMDGGNAGQPDALADPQRRHPDHSAPFVPPAVQPFDVGRHWRRSGRESAGRPGRAWEAPHFRARGGRTICPAMTRCRWSAIAVATNARICRSNTRVSKRRGVSASAPPGPR